MQRNTEVRTKLSMIEGRNSYIAKFVKYGFNPRFPDKETVLLSDIKLVHADGTIEEITDHTWVSRSKRWKAKESSLTAGCIIAFTAEVEEYFKEGTTSYFQDYTLGSIRSIELI